MHLNQSVIKVGIFNNKQSQGILKNNNWGRKFEAIFDFV